MFKKLIYQLRQKTSFFKVFLLSLLLFSSISLISNSLVIGQSATLLDKIQIVNETVIGKPGFFRVGKSTQNRWWLIEPDNKPFFYKGVTSVNFGYPAAYIPTVVKKYGKDPSVFRQAAFERLRSWNFNALGAWTPPELWDQGMPYTVILDFAKVSPKTQLKSGDIGLYLPDVFDSEWIKEIDLKARKVVSPLRNSKLLIGYFTDNELSWGDPERPDYKDKLNPELSVIDQGEISLLQISLSLDAKKPAYQAAWNFVLQQHGNNIQQLGRDWQIDIDSREKIRDLTKKKQAIVSREFLKDHRLFLKEFARRYFLLTAATIHSYDRNHLILGCRFGAPPSNEVFSAVKRPWVDVVSANNYRYEMYERMDIYYQATHLPILNTEFSWGHGVFFYRPLANEPPEGVTSLQRMVQNGEQSLKRAIAHPALVGYTWYRWVDFPSYKPPISYGLVNLQDEPYRLHTDLLTKLNAQAEAIATNNTNSKFKIAFGKASPTKFKIGQVGFIRVVWFTSVVFFERTGIT
ncbi:MAG TPA: hypothetical protein VK203_29675 [Nostocaceae cyanobacterium]|nr:hypothetical protein [Nostocaceae cyanobacterium]